MGYACPVCDDPQADTSHLANHLAFTAMTGGHDHEAWLDETIGDWGHLGEAELGELVAEHAEERQFPQVFEESGLDDHGHDHSMPAGADSQSSRELSEADAAVLEEARELTKEMLDADANKDADANNDETANADAATDADESEDETE